MSADKDKEKLFAQKLKRETKRRAAHTIMTKINKQFTARREECRVKAPFKLETQKPFIFHDCDPTWEPNRPAWFVCWGGGQRGRSHLRTTLVCFPLRSFQLHNEKRRLVQPAPCCRLLDPNKPGQNPRLRRQSDGSGAESLSPVMPASSQGQAECTTENERKRNKGHNFTLFLLGMH